MPLEESKVTHRVIRILSVMCTVETPKPSITSSNSNPRKTETVTLSCEPEIREASYLWWINGQSLPISSRWELSNNNRTLILFNVTENDAGSYECEVKNPVSASRSDPVTLNVLHGLDAPTISSSYNYYHPGEIPKVSCLTDSHPLEEHSWLIDGKFQQSAQVSLSPKSLKHRGVYNCVLHNSDTGRTHLIIKRITVPGKWIPRALAMFPSEVYLDSRKQPPALCKGRGDIKNP
nr:carcinoembryonic antigen-related cell adhesion molecule 6-like [Aotus nancymaae]